MWAEEGISTGPYSANQEGALNEMSVRCVRNFGMDANHSLEDIPQDYVQKEKNPDNGATVYMHILTILTPIPMMLTPSKRAWLSKSSPCLLANRQ